MVAVPKLDTNDDDKGEMMASGCALMLTPATWPIRFRCALLLLVSLGLGCVNLDKPWALTHSDASVAGSPAGGGGSGTGAGGAGLGSDASGGSSADASGAGGIASSGGAVGGIPLDAGMGGNTSPPSSASDAKGTGGNSEVDALSPADYPQATGGQAFDAGSGGAGGSAGQTAAAGGSGSGFDAGTGGVGGSAGQTAVAGGSGTKLDAGSGGTAVRDAAGTGGTSGTGGAAGQDGGRAEALDTAPALDTSSPDKPCALCAIGATLVHRCNFNGTGTNVTDGVGTANGTVMNAQLSGSGSLALTGGTSDQYVDLPDRIFSTLTSATLEFWVTWNGGNNNQRILDFGSNQQSGSAFYAVTTVIISPNSAPDGTPRLRTSYSSQASSSSIFVDAPSALGTGTQVQVVAVFDGQNHTLSMYLNGVLQGQASGLGDLSLIDDTNNWLGKSQYSGDPGFDGTYHEFRIYNAPLTADQVQAIYTAGPNASFSQ